jgi:hypothetical protein
MLLKGTLPSQFFSPFLLPGHPWDVGRDYEKPMRLDTSTAVLSGLQAEFGTAPAAQLLFLSCLCSESNTHFSCYKSHPSLRTVAPPPCLPLYIKDLLKEDWLMDWWDCIGGWLDWWAACKDDSAAAAGCCVSVSLRTKTLREIKETWDNARLRKETLKIRKEARF